jgi:hypothetical protein
MIMYNSTSFVSLFIMSYFSGRSESFVIWIDEKKTYRLSNIAAQKSFQDECRE